MTDSTRFPSVRSVPGTLVRSLLFPHAFFAARTPRTGVAGRAVAAVALLLGLSVAALPELIVARMSLLGSGPTARDLLDTAWGSVADDVVLVGLLVVCNWLVIGVVLHAAARVFGGEGEVGDTLYVVGWSTPAALLSPLLVTAAVALSSPETTFWTGPGDQLDVLAGNVLLAAVFATALVLPWQGYVWRAGLEATHDLDRGTAARVSFLTVLLGGLLALVVLAG
jgi:hypothetical protein